MQPPFFLKKPVGKFRFEVEALAAQVRSGIHESIRGDVGFSFKALHPYDLSASITAIDDIASAAHSEHPDFEPLYRTFYSEENMPVWIMLDTGPTMRVPDQKLLTASAVFWISALSAFDARDTCRVIFFDSSKLIDSGIIFSEVELDAYLSLNMRGGKDCKAVDTGGNSFSYLVREAVCYAVVIVISDFSRDWEAEIDMLKKINPAGSYVKFIFFVLDEWHGLEPSRYRVHIADPATSQMRLMDDAGLERAKEISDERFSVLEKRLRPHGASFVKIPVVRDIVPALQRAFRRGLYVKI